ncbi:MAG: alanine--tRNA ligase [Patescibacteria group bacterium]|nr:alanine--tRNA ligase [Patescibacteria group bacterium]
MKSKELRQKFLDFFEAKGHKIIPSAPLIPSELDPSVLFTTAGMQQFKRFYSEPKEAPAMRIATCQQCVRTGDIEEVGDESHLTFFEMLGNFSFNNYGKKEAIEWAWEFLTDQNWLGIDKKRIDATYFDHEKAKKGISIIEDTDLESLAILKTLSGLNKIEAQGEDNFWSLGTEGSPGGPTVEFYIDGVEVWNLVFNEWIFKESHWHSFGVKGVDTGMGLERLIAVLNMEKNVYDTDLFQSIIKKIEELSGKKYQDNQQAFRIIADHLRAATFLIADGVEPSNKERGYIVRRLIRRAIVKAKKLGIENIFVAEIADEVVEIYKDIYSELENKRDNVKQTLQNEEEKFRKTLSLGLKEFEKIKQDLTGQKAFRLYETYGFPLEMTEELAKEQNVQIDKEEFKKAFKEHQKKSRTASVGMFKGGLADSGEETKKLHTAAHLLLAALRQVLGNGVFQKGSNITSERLRFDFSHNEKLTSEQLKQVEDLVNEQIQAAIPVEMTEMGLNEAKKSGAMGVFESKYGDKVKVYTIDGFSNEICGGPHVENTKDLGYFKIVKEESSSAGVRRIKAILK